MEKARKRLYTWKNEPNSVSFQLLKYFLLTIVEQYTISLTNIDLCFIFYKDSQLKGVTSERES